MDSSFIQQKEMPSREKLVQGISVVLRSQSQLTAACRVDCLLLTMPVHFSDFLDKHAKRPVQIQMSSNLPFYGLDTGY